MAYHTLKLFTEYFEPVASGKKKCEVRFNDRNFKVGDVVTFREGQHSDGEFIYTGRNVSARISYINDFGLQDGYVNLSLDEVGILVAWYFNGEWKEKDEFNS